jgi:hypothetical protein
LSARADTGEDDREKVLRGFARDREKGTEWITTG